MPYKDKLKQRAYQLEWTKQNRSKWLIENGPCSTCSSWENLEVDHIDPDKKVSHRIWTWSESRRIKELSKCQVLCASCHLEKTGREKYLKAAKNPCGTESKYQFHRRYEEACQACLDAHNRHTRKYKK